MTISLKAFGLEPIRRAIAVIVAASVLGTSTVGAVGFSARPELSLSESPGIFHHQALGPADCWFSRILQTVQGLPILLRNTRQPLRQSVRRSKRKRARVSAHAVATAIVALYPTRLFFASSVDIPPFEPGIVYQLAQDLTRLPYDLQPAAKQFAQDLEKIQTPADYLALYAAFNQALLNDWFVLSLDVVNSVQPFSLRWSIIQLEPGTYQQINALGFRGRIVAGHPFQADDLRKSMGKEGYIVALPGREELAVYQPSTTEFEISPVYALVQDAQLLNSMILLEARRLATYKKGPQYDAQEASSIERLRPLQDRLKQKFNDLFGYSETEFYDQTILDIMLGTFWEKGEEGIRAEMLQSLKKHELLHLWYHARQYKPARDIGINQNQGMDELASYEGDAALSAHPYWWLLDYGQKNLRFSLDRYPHQVIDHMLQIVAQQFAPELLATINGTHFTLTDLVKLLKILKAKKVSDEDLRGVWRNDYRTLFGGDIIDLSGTLTKRLDDRNADELASIRTDSVRSQPWNDVLQHFNDDSAPAPTVVRMPISPNSPPTNLHQRLLSAA